MNYTTANLSISCKWVVRYHVWRRNHLWHYLDWDSLTKECVVIFAQDLSDVIITGHSAENPGQQVQSRRTHFHSEIGAHRLRDTQERTHGCTTHGPTASEFHGPAPANTPCNRLRTGPAESGPIPDPPYHGRLDYMVGEQRKPIAAEPGKCTLNYDQFNRVTIYHRKP